MSETIKRAVKDRYGEVAESSLSSKHEGAKDVAKAFGYSDTELASIPAEANMGLSCGNPTALAGLKPGETIVDLGCGGGLDVFLAAAKVGPTGRAIGIDMTEAMIERARKNADQAGYDNVEFHLAEIEDLPLEPNSIDCVISNCVLNLVPDKDRAFAEIFRVLKPGGRLVASDIGLKKALPPDLAKNVAAYVGCIAGALEIEAYVEKLKRAGFGEVQVVDSGSDLNAYAKLASQAGADGPCCCAGDTCTPSSDTAYQQELGDVLTQYDVNEYAASVKVTAFKP